MIFSLSELWGLITFESPVTYSRSVNAKFFNWKNKKIGRNISPWELLNLTFKVHELRYIGRWIDIPKRMFIGSTPDFSYLRFPLPEVFSVNSFEKYSDVYLLIHFFDLEAFSVVIAFKVWTVIESLMQVNIWLKWKICTVLWKKIMFATSDTQWRKSKLYSSHLNFLYHLVSIKV